MGGGRRRAASGHFQSRMVKGRVAESRRTSWLSLTPLDHTGLSETSEVTERGSGSQPFWP